MNILFCKNGDLEIRAIRKPLLDYYKICRESTPSLNFSVPHERLVAEYDMYKPVRVRYGGESFFEWVEYHLENCSCSLCNNSYMDDEIEIFERACLWDLFDKERTYYLFTNLEYGPVIWDR